MKNNFLNLIKGETSRGTIIIAMGIFINAFFSMVFVYLCSRILTIFDFGLFSVCLTTWFLLQEIFDFGLNNLVIRLASKYLTSDFKKSTSIFITGFSIRLFLGIVIFLSFIFLGRFFSKNLLNQGELYIPFVIIAFGEIGAMVFASLISVVLTLKKFNLYTSLYSFQGLSRLILLGFFYKMNWLNFNSLMFVIIISPFLAFILGVFSLPKNIWAGKLEKKYFILIFNYIKWLFLWTLFVAISNRIYVYIITSFKGPEMAGVYNLSYLFASIPSLLTGSFSNVLLPKISRLNKDKEIIYFYIKSMKAVLVLAIFMILVMIPGAFFLSRLFADKYSLVAQTFQGLTIGMALIVLSTPATTILWFFDQPAVFSKIAVSQFILTLSLGLILIKNQGLNGAIISFCLVSLFVFLITNILLLRIFKKRGLKI